MIFTDDFNRADGALGTSSDGQFTWTLAFGTVTQIVSNAWAAINIPAASSEITVTDKDTQGERIFVQARLLEFGRQPGTNLEVYLLCRVDPTFTSGYVWAMTQQPDDSYRAILVSLYDNQSYLTPFFEGYVPVIGAMYKMTIDRQRVAVWVNDVCVASGDLTGQLVGDNTRFAGLAAAANDSADTNSCKWGDFSYGDLPATENPIYVLDGFQ